MSGPVRVTRETWLDVVLQRVTQKQSRAVLEALQGNPDWRLVDLQHAGLTAVFSHISADVEHPTPDYIRPSAWPGKTYHRFRSIGVTLGPDWKIIHRSTSEGAPWAQASQRVLSNPKAIEFIREPVSP